MLKSKSNWRTWPIHQRRQFLEKLREISSDNTGFKSTYFNAPAAFVMDCFVWPDDPTRRPSAYQLEILEELTTRKRVCVRSPHGAGKTALMAWLTWWFALTRDGEDWKIPTTASNWRQLDKFLWPEIHKWAKKLDWEKIGRLPLRDGKELLDLSIKLGTGEAFAIASDQPAMIEGAHADHLLYQYDEAKTIPAETFDAAEGAFAAGNCLAACFSTPGDMNGRFYEIQSRQRGYENWWVRHITLEEAIKAGRISKEWAMERKRQWGDKSSVYINRVLGDFAATEEDNVIALANIEAAVERWNVWSDNGKPGEYLGVGVDVARYGTDRTVLAPMYEAENLIAFENLIYSTKEDTMQTTGRVVPFLNRGGHAVIDVVGIGAGVVDRLREQGFEVMSFNTGERTRLTDKSGEVGFADTRSAAWWMFREALSPQSDRPIALPDDSYLIGDLTAPTWRMTSTGKIKVESKDDIKKRLGRSTDSADAVIMNYFGLLAYPSAEILRLGA